MKIKKGLKRVWWRHQSEAHADRGGSLALTGQQPWVNQEGFDESVVTSSVGGPRWTGGSIALALGRVRRSWDWRFILGECSFIKRASSMASLLASFSYARIFVPSSSCFLVRGVLWRVTWCCLGAPFCKWQVSLLDNFVAVIPIYVEWGSQPSLWHWYWYIRWLRWRSAGGGFRLFLSTKCDVFLDL